MDNPVVWSATLLGAAVILFLMEVVFPSGVMAVAAGLCAIVGIVLLFKVSTTVGLLGAVISIIGLPLLVVFLLHLWPNTPIVSMLLLRNPPTRPSTQPHGPGQAMGADENASGYPPVGATGKAVSDLRPVGICIINGRRVDCLAEGGIIRAGTEVRVTIVDGMHIKVRPTEEV